MGDGFRYDVTLWSDDAGSSLPHKVSLFSLSTRPSPMLCAVVEGTQDSISSRIAVEMSHQAACERAMEYYAALQRGDAEQGELPVPTAVLREACKAANQRVYEYAHRMAAGGKIAARGFLSCFDGSRFSVARVGDAVAFLWRDEELAALYAAGLQEKQGVLRRFFGANAQVLVDLASVEVRDGDVFLAFSRELSPDVLRRLDAVLLDGEPFAETMQGLAGDYASFGESLESPADGSRCIVGMMLRVGQPVIRLTEVVSR